MSAVVAAWDAIVGRTTDATVTDHLRELVR
jgi:hypothetical protein